MRSLRWMVPGALLSLVACGSVDRNALEGAGPADAGQTATDQGAVTIPDTGSPAVITDSGNPVVTPPLDAGVVVPPPLDAGVVVPPPVDASVVVPPPVDAGVVVPPPVDAGACRACTPFAPVTFCPGTGAGACLSYNGCTSDGCGTCASALAGGDSCSDPIIISSSGQRRTVVSTCGARNDLTTGCNGRGGPDIVIGLRVARRGRVVARLTVPTGVSVNYGYDLPARSCRNDAVFRPCNNNDTSTSQGFDTTLDAGTYYLYVATTVASTIVVETNLP